MKIVKYILFTIIALVLILILSLVLYLSSDSKNPYNNDIDTSLIPTFKEIDIPFVQRHNGEESLPVIASALIDIDNDGVDELFFGGGYDQQDEMFVFKNGGFESIVQSVNLPPKNNLSTLGAASADFDKNGFSDLIVSREDGITIYTQRN